MGNEPGFIGFGRIGMVEKMVGEVEGRSQKDGSRVQVVLRSRDEGSMKSSFEKLRGIFSFPLLPQAPLLFHCDKSLPW